MNDDATRPVPVPALGCGAPGPRRLSRILTELSARTGEAVTIAEIRQALGDRSFATLLVFFAGINLLPFPPGSTLILGVPLLLIAAQMTFGARTAWLPNFVLSKSVSGERFRQIADKLVPRLVWLEKLIRPRYWPFAGMGAERFVGVFALVLATIVTLPIPFGNWLPAFACTLVGLALSERDGVLLGAAIVCALVSLVVIGGIIGTAGAMASMLLH